MKIMNKLCYIFSAMLLVITVEANTQESNGLIEVVRQEMKCHVELIGGNETIYFTGLFRGETVSIAKNKLEGNEILTVLSPKKLVIYKVNECVLKDASFTSSIALNLERTMEL